MVTVMVLLVVVVMRHHGHVKLVTGTRGSHHIVYSLHRWQQGFRVVKVLLAPSAVTTVICL